MKRVFVTEYSDYEFREILKETLFSIFKDSGILKPPLAKVENHSLDNYLDRKQVCELLHLSYPTLLKLQREGKIKGKLVGGTYRYSLKQIKNYFNSSKED